MATILYSFLACAHTQKRIILQAKYNKDGIIIQISIFMGELYSRLSSLMGITGCYRKWTRQKGPPFGADAWSWSLWGPRNSKNLIVNVMMAKLYRELPSPLIEITIIFICNNESLYLD